MMNFNRSLSFLFNLSQEYQRMKFIKQLKNNPHLFTNDSLKVLDRMEQLKLSDANKPLQIVVFGKYNHGKSSFLNACLCQSIFKTADTRCTVNVQNYYDRKTHIEWIDTPGLDADSHDTHIAEKAIQAADVCFVIHDALAGELDQKEVAFLRDYAQGMGKGKVSLLLTKIDQVADRSVELIQRRIKKQLKGLSMSVFAISSTRYQHYLDKQSALFLEKSGFSAIFPLIDRALADKSSNRATEMQQLSRYLLDDLQETQSRLTEQLRHTQQSYQQEEQAFNAQKNHLFSHL